MKRILLLLLLCLPVRAQIPLLINEVDQSVFYPTGAIGGTLSVSNIAIVQSLSIGGQSLSNLVGSGLTNNAGTLQATGSGGGGGGTTITVDGGAVPSPVDFADSFGINVTFSAGPIIAWSLANRDWGDITTSGSGLIMSVDDGAITLNELSDVAITAPAAGQVLIHNGSTWLNSAANPYQATNANLTTVSSLTGGTSTNFFSGDGTFKQVTTNMIPGLNAHLSSLVPSATLLNVLPIPAASGAAIVLDFGYSALTYAVTNNVILQQSTNRPTSSTNVLYSVVRFAGDSVDRTLSWPGSWKRLGTNIATIPANKVVLVSAMCIGTAESGVTFGIAKEE